MAKASLTRADFGRIVENLYNFLIDRHLLDEYKTNLLSYASSRCVFNNDLDMPLDVHIKLLTLMKEFTRHFTDEELSPYNKLFYLKNINEVNEWTIDFFNKLNRTNNNQNEYTALKNMKLTRRVRRLAKIEVKRILKRLGLFDTVKRLAGRH